MKQQIALSKKMTLGDKITDLKRQYLKAVSDADTTKANELLAAITVAEKFGFAPDQCYPLFFECEIKDGKNYFPEYDVILSEAEVASLEYLKQHAYIVTGKTYEEGAPPSVIEFLIT